MLVTEAESFKLGDWLIEPELLQISRPGEVRKLEFRTMEILQYLVANRADVVSKQKLHDEVYEGVYVTDNSLTKAVSKLRKALDDDPLNPCYIDTISKSGYRLIAPVVFDPVSSPSSSTDSTPSARRRWIWGLIAIIVFSGIGWVSSLSRDLYSEFYDPVPVSTLVGPEEALSISPDGQKISFTYIEPGASFANLYVKLLEDLSQVQFTNLNSHQGLGIWSPDGNHMAYVSLEDGTCGIYKEPSFGGEKTRIGDCFTGPQDFVWSPDGKTIAFSDQRSPQHSRRIFFLDLQTQVVEEAMSPESGISDRDPAFSPDGAYVVFRRTITGLGRDIYKMRIADTAVTRLTFDNARILGLDVFDDGKQIAFASNRGGIWAMWKVPLAGGEVTRLHVNDRVPIEPRFSQDGKRMIYKSIRDQTKIWAANKDGEKYESPVQMVSSTRAEAHPALSGDGKKMVFLSNRSGYFEIWSTDFGQNSPTKLTSLEGSFLNMPSWSPDGTEVVFDARVDQNNAVYILDVASKLKRTFVDLEGDQINARYSRDGETIYFASNHGGSWQIWKKPLVGDEITQVTVNGGYVLQEGPDDGSLYYSRLDTVGIWKTDGGREELFIPALSDVDWGNWATTKEGIIYLDRSFGQQVYFQSYNMEEQPRLLFTPQKTVQMWSPSLIASDDGSKIMFVQIENKEDEIMMVNFN